MSKMDLAIDAWRGPAKSTPIRRSTKLWLCFFLIAADALALLLSLSAGIALGARGPVSPDIGISFVGALVVYAAISFQNQAYNPKCLVNATFSCRQALLSLAGTLFLFLLTAFSLKITASLPRLGLSIGLVATAVLVPAQRILLCNYVRRTFGDKLYAKLVIVDGAALPADTQEGDVVHAGLTSLKPDLDDPYMLSRLGSLFQPYHRVVISCAPERKAEWAQVLKGANILGEIIVPEMSELGPLSVNNLNGVTTVVVSRGPLNVANRAKKRALDMVLTLAAMTVLLPLMVAVGLAIKLDSPGPVFFRQERMGRGNRIFHILKFRSMRVESCDSNGNVSTRRDDDRITKVGRFVRRTSIDELPQLINVLKGEMSLVGPRPHALGSTAGDELFWRVDRQYWRRHALKPGITGLAQIRGFRGATEERSDIVNRLEADLEYLNQWSLLQDVAILARTVQVMVHRNAY